MFNGLSYIILGNFLSKFVALLSSILIARFVDKSEYAYLSYADNLYSYIGLFTGLGLASALLVVCTPNVSLGKQHNYLGKALKYGGFFEVITALLLCVGVQFIGIPFPEARKYMWILLLYPLTTYLFNTLQAFIRVKRNNKLYAGLGASQTIIVCVFSILFVLFLDAIGVVFARYIAVIAVLIMAVMYIRKVDGHVISESLRREEHKRFIMTGMALMFANLFSGMMPINEAFIVNNLIKDEVITANFKVAGIIPSMLPIITSSVMVYYFPIIAAMKNGTEIKKKVFNIALINGIIIIIITIIGMFLTPFSIGLVYGQKYADAANISYSLWAMRAVNAVLRMVPLNILAAIGQSKFNAYVSVVTCVIHAVLDYVFIYKWGVNGIAYAAIIAYIISSIVMWLHFTKTCNKQII
nr:polysaccharide biosynthesis C-terminal domain-containing protein [Lactonifactor longoviformis]